MTSIYEPKNRRAPLRNNIVGSMGHRGVRSTGLPGRGARPSHGIAQLGRQLKSIICLWASGQPDHRGLGPGPAVATPSRARQWGGQVDRITGAWRQTQPRRGPAGSPVMFKYSHWVLWSTGSPGNAAKSGRGIAQPDQVLESNDVPRLSFPKAGRPDHRCLGSYQPWHCPAGSLMHG